MATDDSFFIVFPKFCLITAGSLLTYIIAGYFLEIEQVRPILERVKAAVFRPPKANPHS